MIHTRCTHASSGGTSQYRAYCGHTGTQETINSNNKAGCKFGVGGITSKSTDLTQFVINNVWLRAKMHIVDADVPLLLSLAGMDHLRLCFDTITNTIVHLFSHATAPFTRNHGQPLITWNPLTHCLFTESELRRLPQRFGHPDANNLYKLLKRSDYSDAEEGKTKMLRDVTRSCKP